MSKSTSKPAKPEAKASEAKLRDLIAGQQPATAAPRNDSTPPAPPELVVAAASVDSRPASTDGAPVPQG